jgi:FlaA1/EpsC-like NDP-sugar epimerase
VATAIAPDAEQRVVGIRPGEKLHEEMITASDSPHTVDLGAYYAILPAGGDYTIDDYCARNNGKRVKPGFCYDSGSNSDFLSVPQLEALISTHVGPGGLHSH